MEIKRLLQDYGIPFDESGKNVQDGWIGLNCPFCSDPSNHLGYNLDEEFGENFSCWRCNFHYGDVTISKLLNVDIRQARKIMGQYKGKSQQLQPEKEIGTKDFQFPSGTGPLNKVHRNYLKRRKFDPDYLEAAWKIKGIGAHGVLRDEENIYDYRLRILAPIYWTNKTVVSFQTRDITDKSDERYKACPQEYEKIHHKDILYINPRKLQTGGTGLCCEGITDVWKLGFDGFGTFGIKFTSRQIRSMAKIFDRVFVLFDPEEQAQQQAEKLVGELRFRRIKAERIELFQDPGSMSDDNAQYLVQTLKHRKL